MQHCKGSTVLLCIPGELPSKFSMSYYVSTYRAGYVMQTRALQGHFRGCSQQFSKQKCDIMGYILNTILFLSCFTNENS